MTRDVSPAWGDLLWEARGYLGLDEDEPVPVDELVAQAKANGYAERSVREALRDTDAVVAVDGRIDEPRVRLAEDGGEQPSRGDCEDETPTPDGSETTTHRPDSPRKDGWGDVDFSTSRSDSYPPALVEREQWMGRLEGEKLPFSPWGDRDHPEADADTDARYKWGLSENYVDGETVAIAEDDPRLGGRIFIQQDDDGLAFVDGDDVRDPETGEVHPAFVELLERLGVSYADVSTSGSGVHVYYFGDLPNDQGQAVFDIDDEPWGANDDAPTVEIYANKHVCVTTGERCDGSPERVFPWDDEAVEAVLEEYDAKKDPAPVAHDTDRDLDLDDHDPEATGRSETTGDVRDIVLAVDRLRPKDLPLRTRQVDTDPTGWEKWDPSSYRTSSGGDSLHRPPGEPVFHDHKHGEAFGVLSLFAAEEGIISKPWDRLAGDDWWAAVDAAREAGAGIPEYDGGEDDEEEYRADPLDAEAVFAPRRAWEAAGAVDLDPLGLPDAPDVVRAVAIAEGEADDVAEASQLGGEDYFRLYELARTEYDADLPIYVDATRAVDDFDAARAAVEHLKGWHILDELKSEITVENPGGEALAKINPTWEESESGERIIAFDSGLFWCAEHDTVIDPLRVVALENGLIDGEEDTPTGQTYLDAYELARTEYDAPLPRIRWLDSDVTPDPDAEVVLPPADELVGEFTTDRDGLDAWRDRTEDLYRDLADDASRDVVLTAEPSTGKSTAAVKTAVDKPTLLLAPRREMQAEYLAKANNEELFDGDTPSAYILPVFSEPWEGVSEEAVDAGVGAVREDDAGLDLLKDGDALRAAVEERLDANDTLEAPEPDEDVTILDRATDDTAAGEYGLEWALRASVAHRLGLRPQTIHERDTEIFGEPLPCHHTEAEEEDRTCSYTEAYDLVTDPERPIDLLIGSRVHANVESAKTYHYMEDETPRKRPRVVAIDEDPVGDYQTLWEDDARHVATWLGRVLVEDVEDGVDLQRQADTLRDSWVNRWLREDGAEALADMHARVTVGGVLAQVAAEADAEDVGDIRTIVGEEGAVTTGEAVTALEDLLNTRRRELSERTDQLLRWLSDEGKLDAVKQLPEDEERPLASFDLPEDVTPDTAFVSVVNRAFDALAEGWDLEDGDTDRLVGEFHTAADVVEGGEDAVLELVVAERSGYAHPDAHLLLAGALGGGEPLECHTELLPNREEPGRANFVEVGRSRVSYDRDGEGAVVFDPPAFEVDAGRCSVVGLDATAEKVLWWVFTGLEVDTVSPFDSAEERREFVRDTRNIQVVQTDTRDVNTYSGDPTSKSFAEDLALVEEVAEKYGGRQLRRDSLTSTGDPAVISTKKALDYLGDDLEEHASATENYWNFTGSNALGDHNIGVVLGATHPGDAVIERAAVGAGETIDPQGHGPDKTYGGEVADAMLRYVWQHQITQAVHRFGREEDGAIVFVHSAAVDEERLPVEGVGGALTAWSDAGKAVRDAMLPYLRVGAEFTVGDIVDEVDYGRRAVQKKLAEFERLGYVDRTVGGPGRANVFDPVEDPGERGHLDLPGGESVRGVESEQGRNTIQYTGSFGILAESPPSPSGATPASGVLPAPATATAGPARGDPGG